jgi:hypothetical protein
MVRSRYLAYRLVFLFFVLGCIDVQAQRNAALRYEIDAKRMGTDMNSEDALPRSREFKRIDSSYYVGWMYEGSYKFNHAADYLGFKNAAIPLERALTLMERDYRRELATRTSDIMQYFPVYKYHIDYTLIGYYLMNCYSNTEDVEKVHSLLRRVLKWNFQRDYQMDVYNLLGWTVHRNRYYTSTKYSFLKNSIDENERYANRLLDSGLRRITINKRLNSQIFQPGYEEFEKQSVYHYKSILYSYALKIDSAAMYYNLLRNTPIFPHNNYATFRTICGDFREAESEYQQAVMQDAGDKRLKEWAYYSSIIDIYKARPDRGSELMRDMIKANGSTPGFGWYNIALARTEHYNGLILSSDQHATKAAGFKEVHIGTTLSQAHYDFSVQLVRLMNKQSLLNRQKFENKNWWYNPRIIARMSRLLGEKYMQQFLIINQFAQNPERDRVIYKLFSTESTVSWDEVWYLVKDFSTQFFVERFKKEAQTDERKIVRKYFKLFVARLKMEQGENKEAQLLLNEVLQDANIDPDYEKLFLARVYQAQAECALRRKNNAAYNEYMYRLYQIYPQLVPDTELKTNMRLNISGSPDDIVVDRLKDCNIEWVTNSSIPAPSVYLVFSGAGAKKRLEFYVLDREGKYIVEKQAIDYDKSEAIGVSLAYRLFNIGGMPRTEETQEVELSI